jgi:SAM-dependent methyltransferase
MLLEYPNKFATCKICGSQAAEKFRVPRSKETGKPIPSAADDCRYFECPICYFCFSCDLDVVEHRDVYGDAYWGELGDVRLGVPQAFRLTMMASQLLEKPIYECDILDFGCGRGNFIEVGRNETALQIWGTDINAPPRGKEYFLPAIDRQFDIIVSVEVIEHLIDPLTTFRTIKSWLKPEGVFAFQTACYDPGSDRTWWYIGPANGHISFYSQEAFDYAFALLGGRCRVLWRGYPGIQAWQF